MVTGNVSVVSGNFIVLMRVVRQVARVSLLVVLSSMDVVPTEPLARTVHLILTRPERVGFLASSRW